MQPRGGCETPLPGRAAVSSESDTAPGPLEAIDERLAFHELEHDRLSAAGLLEFVNRADVRLIERGEHRRPPGQTGDPIGIV
jgi:hypothetical protein